jgi:RimJ/RimL family protein N-acetyltransferase
MLGTDEAVSFTQVHNVRSRAVMQHLGMSFVGEIRAPGLVDGEEGIDDEARFALYSARPAMGRTLAAASRPGLLTRSEPGGGW